MEYTVFGRDSKASEKIVICECDCLKTALAAYLNYGKEIKCKTPEGK